MNRTKMVVYPLVGAVVTSVIVLLVGLLAFGLQVSEWSEWQGRVIGIAGTVAAVVVAAVGFWIAYRGERGQLS